MIIGYGNPTSVSPWRAWCLQEATFRPFIQSDPNNPASGEPGRTRLFLNNRRIASDTCAPDSCNDETITISGARQFAPAGSTLRYDFRCIENEQTPEEECADDDLGGSTIEIFTFWCAAVRTSLCCGTEAPCPGDDQPSDSKDHCESA